MNCEQIFFVISGTGKIFAESGDYQVKEGDLVYIKKGEKYSVEGQKLFMVITNSPKWTFEQYKSFEK
jgi:mannose-6-phosphate isomerase-like protein (cupin superfamily)